MSHARMERIVLAAIAAFAVLLTIKYFPGFESETAYAGNAFQAIHPDAFAGDAYRGPERTWSQRPFQLSLIYLVIKFTGEIWLDDRFVAVVYVGLVFAGLLGIDRIAKLLGITGPAERLIILMLFLKDHHILGNNVLLAHHPDVNHFAFAIPIIIWLTYAALARKGLAVVLVLSVLLILVSIRNAVFPIAFALVLVAWHGSNRDRVIVGTLFAGGLVIAYLGLFVIYPMDHTLRMEMWDLIRNIEHSAANPFHGDSPVYVALTNALFLGLCGAVFAFPSRPERGFGDIRLIVAMGLCVWAISGLYITFAPDAIKMPLLIDLAPVRALALPQNLAYIALSAGLFIWLRERGSAGPAIITGMGLAVLFLLGPGDVLRWTALLAAAAVTTAMAHFMSRKRAEPGGDARGLPHTVATARPVVLIASVLGLTIAVAYATASWQKQPGWSTLARHGVFGDSASAKWIGVAEYVRENTLKTASVLPFYWLPGHVELNARRSFATRSGRAMPVPEPLSDFLNPNAWLFEAEQQTVVRSAGAAIVNRAYPAAAEAVERLVPVPDYIIVPTEVITPFDSQEFPYVEEARIREYSLLRRITGKPH